MTSRQRKRRKILKTGNHPKLYISDFMLAKLVNQINWNMERRWSKWRIYKKNGFLVLELSENEKLDYYSYFMITSILIWEDINRILNMWMS